VITRKGSIGTEKSGILRKKQSIPSVLKGIPLSADENTDPEDLMFYSQKV
jgi:hypothetical protein